MFQELGLELLCFDLGARIDLYLVQTNLFDSSGKSIHELTLYACAVPKKKWSKHLALKFISCHRVGFEISASSQKKFKLQVSVEKKVGW